MIIAAVISFLPLVVWSQSGEGCKAFTGELCTGVCFQLPPQSADADRRQARSHRDVEENVFRCYTDSHEGSIRACDPRTCDLVQTQVTECSTYTLKKCLRKSYTAAVLASDYDEDAPIYLPLLSPARLNSAEEWCGIKGDDGVIDYDSIDVFSCNRLCEDSAQGCCPDNITTKIGFGDNCEPCKWVTGEPEYYEYRQLTSYVDSRQQCVDLVHLYHPTASLAVVGVEVMAFVLEEPKDMCDDFPLTDLTSLAECQAWAADNRNYNPVTVKSEAKSKRIPVGCSQRMKNDKITYYWNPYAGKTSKRHLRICKRIALDHPYIMGTLGDGWCPSGSAKILAQNHCQNAASILDKYFEVETFNDVDNPAGCFEDPESGFVGFNSNADGQGTATTAPLCRAENPIGYTSYVTGTCADRGMLPITDQAECDKAASDMFFDDTESTETLQDDRPEGCYTKGGQLWFTALPANIGNGAMNPRYPICKPEPRRTFQVVNECYAGFGGVTTGSGKTSAEDRYETCQFNADGIDPLGRPVDCMRTRYGCCPDMVNSKSNDEGTNCDECFWMDGDIRGDDYAPIGIYASADECSAAGMEFKKKMDKSDRKRFRITGVVYSAGSDRQCYAFSGYPAREYYAGDRMCLYGGTCWDTELGCCDPFGMAVIARLGTGNKCPMACGNDTVPDDNFDDYY